MFFIRALELASSTARAGLATGIVVTSLTFATANAARAAMPVVTLTPSIVWAEFSANALHGRLSRVAWSDDRAIVYVQTVEGDTPQTLVFHHYLVRKGGPLVALDAQPDWAGAYWKWKSAKSLAGDQSLTIDVETRKEIVDSLNGIAATKSAYLTDSPVGLSGQDLALAKQSGGTRLVNRLLLKGQVIGEFVDQTITPGYTFSWSPEDLRLIAYRGRSGRLTIMNDEGRTTTVKESKDILLPAWSDDGAAIAYIERARRLASARFSLRVVEVVGR